jgi:hypothetical protein
MWIRAHVQHWNGKFNLLEWDAGGRLSDSSFGALQPFRSASRMTARGRQRPGANRSHRGRLTDLGPKKSSLNSGGVDFCRLVFLIKRIRVRVLGSTRFTSRVAEPAHDPRRQCSDRDGEPCATARVRAYGASRKSVGARSRVWGEPKERRGATRSRRRFRRSRGRWDRRRDRGGNFPPCKALKTHKMRKESRFCASAFSRPAERPVARRKAQSAGGATRQNRGARKWV